MLEGCGNAMVDFVCPLFIPFLFASQVLLRWGYGYYPELQSGRASGRSAGHRVVGVECRTYHGRRRIRTAHFLDAAVLSLGTLNRLKLVGCNYQ